MPAFKVKHQKCTFKINISMATKGCEGKKTLTHVPFQPRVFLRYFVYVASKQIQKSRLFLDHIFYIYWHEWMCLSLSIELTKINKVTQMSKNKGSPGHSNKLFISWWWLLILTNVPVFFFKWKVWRSETEFKCITNLPLKYTCSRVQFQDMFWPLMAGFKQEAFTRMHSH